MGKSRRGKRGEDPYLRVGDVLLAAGEAVAAAALPLAGEAVAAGALPCPAANRPRPSPRVRLARRLVCLCPRSRVEAGAIRRREELLGLERCCVVWAWAK